MQQYMCIETNSNEEDMMLAQCDLTSLFKEPQLSKAPVLKSNIPLMVIMAQHLLSIKLIVAI